jgi:hypothetical protein
VLTLHTQLTGVKRYYRRAVNLGGCRQAVDLDGCRQAMDLDGCRQAMDLDGCGRADLAGYRRTSATLTGSCRARDSSHASAMQNAARASLIAAGLWPPCSANSTNAASSAR